MKVFRWLGSFIYKYFRELLIVFGILIFTQYFFSNKREKERLFTELQGKTQKLQLLTKYSAKLEINYKKQSDLVTKLKKEWAVEQKHLKGRIKVLSNATFLIRERARKQKNSDISYVGKNMKYIVNEIRYSKGEGKYGPPIGYVLIFDDGRVVSRVYNHYIDVKTAVLRDEETGKYNVATKADYVLKSPSISSNEGKWLNKPYPLTIKGGTATIDPTEPINKEKQFYFWAPRLNANINSGVSGPRPGLGVSLMGYGYSKRDLDMRLMQLGIDYDKESGAGATFTPLLWRPLPDTLPNTYIGPGIRKDAEGNELFFGIQIGF